MMMVIQQLEASVREARRCKGTNLTHLQSKVLPAIRIQASLGHIMVFIPYGKGVPKLGTRNEGNLLWLSFTSSISMLEIPGTSAPF